MSEHDPNHSPHDAHDTGDGHDDHGGNGKYIAVFIALCFLTSCSFFTYSHWWPFSKEVAWAFMMAVSCTKAMLVVMFFMHLLWEANWKWVLTIPASFMSIFLLLMLVPDVGMRQYNGYAFYSRERLLYAADITAKKAKELAAEESPPQITIPHDHPAQTQ
jgi:cytochrome c oxidase subunit 4